MATPVNADGNNPDTRNGGDCKRQGEQHHIGPSGDAEKQATVRSMATPKRKTSTQTPMATIPTRLPGFFTPAAGASRSLRCPGGGSTLPWPCR